MADEFEPPNQEDLNSSLIGTGYSHYLSELSPFENGWELGNFSAQLPDRKDEWHSCEVIQTPFSLFVVFPQVALRFDKPYDFKMLTARKNQTTTNGESQLIRHKLTAQLLDKNISVMFVRDARSGLGYKIARNSLADEEDWGSVSKDFEVAFVEMEFVFDQLIFDMKQQGKPIGPVPLSIQMFVDALYTSLIKYQHQSLTQFEAEGNYHDSPEEIHYSKGVILRSLLEHGLKPNKYGCFGQGSKICPEIVSGNSSRSGLSLNNIWRIINDFDEGLAERYVETLKTLLGIYLYHEFGNVDFETSQAWQQVDWD